MKKQGLLRPDDELKHVQKRNVEFEKFNNTMRDLMKVSHGELKAKLDAEKAAKKAKNRRKKHDDRDPKHD
jgi:hypothetical protein